MPMQPGDVHETSANVDGLIDAVGFQPATPLEEGMKEFVVWYERYYDGQV